jgi:hypothetical protein
MHAESRREHLDSARDTAGRQLLESPFVDYEKRWAQPLVGQKTGDDQRPIISKAIAADDDLDHSLDGLAAALDLDRYVGAIAEPVDNPIKASIQQWQKNVERSTRLLD